MSSLSGGRRNVDCGAVRTAFGSRVLVQAKASSKSVLASKATRGITYGTRRQVSNHSAAPVHPISSSSEDENVDISNVPSSEKKGVETRAVVREWKVRG